MDLIEKGLVTVLASVVAITAATFIWPKPETKWKPAISGTPGPVPAGIKLTGQCCMWQERENKMNWCWPVRSDNKCYSADIPQHDQ